MSTATQLAATIQDLTPDRPATRALLPPPR